ncbi:MAG: hypothetical protein COA78_21955 [Blastopirellula sp.]|nr:MAG: hypothetical protein COA78_21955 [Blastopirellula sp.]
MDDEGLNSLLAGSDVEVNTDEVEETSSENENIDEAEQQDAAADEQEIAPVEEEQQTAEIPQEGEDEPHTVPVKTHVAERKKYQAREAEATQREADLRAEIAAYKVQQQNNQQSTQQEDEDNTELMFDDPKAYQAKQDAIRQDERNQDRWSMQYENAGTKYGEEYMNSIIDDLKKPQNKEVLSNLFSETNPAEAAVKWKKQQDLNSEVGGDLDAYRAKLKEELKAELRKDAGYKDDTVGQQNNKTVPPSISDTSGSGSSNPVSMEQAQQNTFDELFGN